MPARNRRPKRLFTVDEANAALPLVRAIAQDMADLARELVERRDRLALLTSGRGNAAKSDLYTQELLQMQEELEKDNERLQEFSAELAELGVEPKNAVEGLIDFPSMMDGRPIYLCWKLGEPEVLHWHEVEAGFAGRQSLTAASHRE